MNSVAEVRALLAQHRGGWVPRGLLGPTSDQLTRLAAEAEWRFVEISLVGVGNKKSLMEVMSEQLELDDDFGANWDALADVLWDVAGQGEGAIIRLKGLADIPEALAQPFVEIFDERTVSGPAPLVIVADPPLPRAAGRSAAAMVAASVE